MEEETFMNGKIRNAGIAAILVAAMMSLIGCGNGNFGREFPTGDFAVQTVAATTAETVTEAKTEAATETQAQTTAASEVQTTAEAVTEAKTEAPTKKETKTEAPTKKETKTEAPTEKETETQAQTTAAYVWHEFASQKLFDDHYEKHVIVQKEFGDITKEQYLQMVNDLLNATGDNILTKTEEDGDLLFYNVDTNEFAVMRPDGIIRSYFKPSAGIDYWNRQ